MCGYVLNRGLNLKLIQSGELILGYVLNRGLNLMLIQSGDLILGYVLKSGFESDTYMLTNVVDVYVKSKRISEAEYLSKFLPDSRENHFL